MGLSSIASVCVTDIASVENILKEITTSIGALARESRSLRINFKVGYLNVNNKYL